MLVEAEDGRGRLLFVTGEPGIGKTRMTEAAAEEAAKLGLLVVWGASREMSGAPAYWPWTEALRACLRDPICARIAPTCVDGDARSFLSRVLPELGADPMADPLPPSVTESPDARFRLFEAVTSLLARFAIERPLFLVLEDLHAADLPSLLLLRFAARELRGARVVLVGTYRDPGPWLDDDRRQILAGAAREATSIPLRELTPRDTRRLTAAFVGRTAAERIAKQVHRITSGNAFFIDRVLREMRDQGAPAEADRLAGGVGIREWIRRWFRYLPSRPREIVGIASVLGQEIEEPLLAELAGASAGDIARLLEAPEERGVIVRVDGSPDHYRFRHALVREAAYADLGHERRQELHVRVAEMLERTGRHAGPAELAHHYLRAGSSPAIAAKALECAEAAARLSLRRLAWADAAARFRDALAALEIGGRPDERRRSALLVEVGAALARDGNLIAARQAFTESFEAARAIGDAELMTHAAIGYYGPFGTYNDAQGVRMLTEALERLGEQDSPLRALLLGRLAVTALESKPRDERRAFAAQALDGARRCGDPAVLVEALTGSWFAITNDAFGRPEDRLPIADEIIALGKTHGVEDWEQWGRIFRFTELVGRADREGALAAVGEESRVAEQLHQPFWRFCVAIHRAMLAGVAGRFAEVEELAAEAAHHGRGIPDIGGSIPMFQRAFLGVELDRPAGIQPLTNFLEPSPELPGNAACLAYTLWESGAREQAAAVLGEFDDARLHALSRNLSWQSGAMLLSNVCVELGDVARAEALAEILRGSENRIAISGIPGYWPLGPVAYALGMLSITMRRFDAAEAHFERARELATKMKAMPWIAYGGYGRARLRLCRGGPGDHPAAVELLAEARRIAETLGMKRLRRMIDEAETARAPGPKGSTFVRSLRREGDRWAIEFDGELVLLKSTKGLEFLALLLAQPGIEMHALDLSDPEEEGPWRTHRRRLSELKDDLAEAERLGDIGRTTRAREEIEMLSRELTQVFGPGVGSKRQSAKAERARLAVTKPIKALIRKVSRLHPALGRHLTATVRTGYYCAHVPDPRDPRPWSVDDGSRNT